jgi:hypothetical protein
MYMKCSTQNAEAIYPRVQIDGGILQPREDSLIYVWYVNLSIGSTVKGTISFSMLAPEQSALQ